MGDDLFQRIRAPLARGDLAAARQELEGLDADLRRTPAFLALYGNVLLRQGEAEKGAQQVSDAALHRPDTAIWASDLALGLFLLGRLDEAGTMADLALQLPDPPAAAFNLLGAMALARGELELAENRFLEALEREPERAEILNNLGGIAVRLGKLEQALTYYEQALALKPELPQAVNGRAAMLVALERSEEAVAEVEEKLRDDPDSIPLRRQLARLLGGAGRYDEARTLLQESVRLAPDSVELLVHLSSLLLDTGRVRGALQALNKARELEPENPQVLNSLSRGYSEAGFHDKALEVVDTLCELYPDMPASLLCRALVLAEKDDFDRAEQDLRTVLAMLPGSVEALAGLGHLLMLTGRLDEAVSCFEEASQLNPAMLASLIEARSFPEDPRVIEQMKSFSSNPLMAKGPRSSMSFALARLQEKRQEYGEAFEYACQANDLVRQTTSYDPQACHRLVQGLISVFSPEFLARFAGKGSESLRPVFVVGMPRSGTTLTEQILCSHPQVFGAGELGTMPAISRLMPKVLKSRALYPFCMGKLRPWVLAHGARYYIKQLDRMDRQALRVVDKLPHNFLHLGLISLIFPRARIIHVRRDPRDVAISNFFTNFKFRHGGMGYAFSLEEIGWMIKDYQRIMAHWRQVLAGRFLEFDYEDLVEEPERVGRRLFEFIGLDWDEQALEFHQTERAVKTASVWQVRQPIYTTSKKRWQHYEEFLGPLHEILEGENAFPS